MCGRYAGMKTKAELIEMFEVDLLDQGILDRKTGELAAQTIPQPGADVPEEFVHANIAPTMNVPVILERIPPQTELPQLALRSLRAFRWGLVPHWAKDLSIGQRMINARSETLLDKPAFKKVALSSRLLVPADGWYEWHGESTVRSKAGRALKQPYFLRPKTDGPWAMAGIYSLWRNADSDPGMAESWVATFSVLTRQAVPSAAHIHDRMPVIFAAEHWANWLDPRRNAPEDVRALLEQSWGNEVLSHPVSTQVNRAGSSEEHLMLPLGSAPGSDEHS